MKEQLEKFAELVGEWGSKMNLVSVPKKEAVLSEHIDDCVRAWECAVENLGAEKLRDLPIVDIGSGAGFPGVVWAILNPNTKVYLIEPREKRVTFLRHVVLKLSLNNVAAICSRFEDLPREQLPQRCIFTSRAVGYDADLIDLMLKDVARNGSVWAVMSGPESLMRIQNLAKRQLQEANNTLNVSTISPEYQLPLELGSRSLFCVWLNP